MLAALHAALLACDSATAVLTRFFGGPITVRHLAVDTMAPDADQRQRLELGADMAWAHRRVNLLRGSDVLSEADIWYVPGRLPPAMLTELRDTATLFGVVVRKLKPRRQSLSAVMMPADDGVALDHRALLVTAAGPIAEVHERYPAAVAILPRASQALIVASQSP